MTNLGTNGEWEDWFDDWQTSITEDGRMTPLVVARGNHERNNEILEILFDTPPRVYYGLTIGGNLLRLYTLNSEEGIAGNQSTWLDQDLTTHADKTWKFVQYHTPMRPVVSGKPDGSEQYESWAEIFFKHKVQLVNESDSHAVKSTWPIKPMANATGGFVRDDNLGTVYIGEGAWGAPLRNASDINDKPWLRDSASFNHFNWIFIDQEKIEIRTVKVDNQPVVGSLSEKNIFAMPQGLDLWAPTNGAVVTIKR
jgi:hypothetical protein